MTTTALLLGSVEFSSAPFVTIDGNAREMPTGPRYLDDPNDDLSWLDALVDEMTVAGVTTPAAFITQGRRVRLTGGANFTVTWTDSRLRDMLGFTGNLSGASAYTASRVSSLLWAPGMPESPEMAPLGCEGARYYDVSIGEEPHRPYSVVHATAKVNAFAFRYVDMDRIQTSDELNGEYAEFFDNVLLRQYSWKLYRNVTEQAASTTEMTLGTPLGPYVARLRDSNGLIFPFKRSDGFQWVDAFADVRIECRTVAEYTT